MNSVLVSTKYLQNIDRLYQGRVLLAMCENSKALG